MRTRSRHPALETAVFAAALLLSAFVARELWRRHGSAPSAAPAAVRPEPAPAPSPAAGGKVYAMERAVTSVPSMRITRIERRKPRPAPVPAP